MVLCLGDTVSLQWGDASALHYKAGTWCVEYGRGFIPSMMPYGAADTLFSTLDFVGLFRFYRNLNKAMFLDLAYSAYALIDTT